MPYTLRRAHPGVGSPLLLRQPFQSDWLRPAHALSDQQHKFVTDVVNHGGPSMDQMITPAVMETGKTLGDAVCADLHQGNAAANEVIGVSHDMHMPMSQAEVVVYWAITDLCTDQMSQRQDHWRDGN